MSNVLVLAEYAAGKPKKASLAAVTFAKQAAEKSGGDFFIGLIGSGLDPVVDGVAGLGAKKVFVVDGDAFKNYLAEAYAPAVVELAKRCDAKLVTSATSAQSKDLLPRVAVTLDAAMASDVLEVVDAKTFKRPMWAGNVTATVELTTDVKVCTVRGTEFEPAAAGGSASETEKVDVSVDLGSFKAKYVGLKEIKSERPDATVANVVIAGGRGVKSADGFKTIEQLADVLNGGIGASRAVCDAGWCPNNLQVGQTGKVIAPDLYIGAGISGAIQHVAGIKGSKVIVAVNKDPEAPIFQVADYGLVADLFDALPKMIEGIKKLKSM